MSYDVLAALRRRLVAPGGVDRSDRPPERAVRPSGGTADPATDAEGTLRADGGEREEPEAEEDEDAHLRDLPDGAGCAEIWEHLSERQAEERRSEEGRAIECRADD